jgi:hypothetical protein
MRHFRHVRGRAPLGPSFALIATLFAVGASNAIAQTPKPEKVRVTGVVIDEASGQPIAGALVKIDHASAYTDGDGRFVINKVEQGTRRISVDQLGYVYQEINRSIDDSGSLLRLEVEPQPIILEAISVINNRLERRRRAVATTARAFEGEDLRGANFDAMDFVQTRAGLFPTRCPARSFATHCVYRRGSVVEPTVYIDEMRVFGGLETLQTIPMEEVYRVEVFGGRQVRIYTRRYTEFLARHPKMLQSIIY